MSAAPGGRRPAPAVLVAAALAGLLAGAPAALAAKEAPALAARVNDLANLVSSAARGRLETMLEAVERRTGAQVAVLTVDSLEGDTIEDFAVRVFQAWKLGRRGVDDGVLLVVARQERRLRIEVGYGLEGRLTDARARQILDDVVRPRFREGQFGPGIEAGVEAIVAAIEGAPAPPARPGGRPRGSPAALALFAGMFLLVIGTFSVIALLAPGAAGWALYVFLLPFYATFPSLMFPRWGGMIAALTWLVAFPLLRRLLRTPRAKRFRARHGWAASPGGSGGRWQGGGWSGGSGGGGFSGGGGGSGGGGASSSW